MPVDHLCFDMAASLHEVLKDDTNPPRLFKRLFLHLDRIISAVNPRQSVVFAFDGVAPYAKMATQRKRRSTGSQSAELTPGTELMSLMEANMASYVIQRSSRFHDQLRFFISGPQDPVEGEVKIVQWVLDHVSCPEDKVLIVGSDGDLIVQCLLLGTQPIRSSSTAFHAFPNLLSSHQSISSVAPSDKGPSPTKARGYLLRNMTSVYETFASLLRVSEPANRSHAADVALLFLLLGNDYLPKLSMSSFAAAIATLAELFASLPPAAQHLFDLSRGTLHWPNVLAFMQRLHAAAGSHSKETAASGDPRRQSPVRLSRVDLLQVFDVWRQRRRLVADWNVAVVSPANAEALRSLAVDGCLVVDGCGARADSPTVYRLDDIDRGAVTAAEATLHRATLTLTAAKGAPPAAAPTGVFTCAGLFRTAKDARRAVAAQLLDADAERDVYVETLFHAENRRVDAMQRRLDALVDEFNAQLPPPSAATAATAAAGDVDFVAFLRRRAVDDADADALSLLRRLDVRQLRRATDDDVECYLSGLVWVAAMYRDGRCADFGYQFSPLFRPAVGPDDVARYLRATLRRTASSDTADAADAAVDARLAAALSERVAARRRSPAVTA